MKRSNVAMSKQHPIIFTQLHANSQILTAQNSLDIVKGRIEFTLITKSPLEKCSDAVHIPIEVPAHGT